jgi:OmpA-OmpF porin, OOP family
LPGNYSSRRRPARGRYSSGGRYSSRGRYSPRGRYSAGGRYPSGGPYSRPGPGIGRGTLAALIGGGIVVVAVVVALALTLLPDRSSPSARATTTALPSGTCLSAAGVPLTLVVGERSNVPRVQYPSYLDSLVTTAAEDGQPITLIRIDGSPKVLPLEQFSGSGYGTGAALQAAVSRYVNGVFDILNGPDLRAVTPQADVLDALTLAAAQTPAGGNIIVIDSGLQTAGALLYQDQGTLMAPASDVVQFLRQNPQGSLIPDMQGRHVLLSGFGYTAAPQASLDQPEQQNVVDQWKAIVTAGGASVCVDPSANTQGELTGLPAVATVPLPAPVFFNACGNTVLSDQGSVGFNDNESTFRSPSLAQATLLQLAQKLKNGTETITLIGSTSSEGSEAHNYTLSGERAQAVAQVLEQDGVHASRIRIVPDGPNYPGRVKDTGPDGQLILSAAEQDREVIVQLPQCT